MTALAVNCLGDLVAYHCGVAIPKLTNSKALALWVYVALESNPCPRAKLAAFFWGDLDDAAARSNLRQTLMRLRQLLPDFIEVDHTQVGIPRSASYEIDLLQLRAQLAADLPPLEDLQQANVQDLFIGLQLRNAPQLDEWISRQRETFAVSYLATLSRAAQAVAASNPVLAIELHRRCLSFAPWDEGHHRALMELFISLGDRAAALAQFETCKLALASELDVTPEPMTLELHSSIKAASGALRSRSPRTQAPFSTAPRFADLDSNPQLPTVNRVREQQQIHDLLLSDSGRIVSIVGPGGAGKTHLATHVGRTLREDFANRVHFVPLVDLQPSSDAECESLLIRRVLEVLEISFVPGSERAALEQALKNSHALLILDNFEAFSTARNLLATLSIRSSDLRILITTRHQLGLATEWIIKIDGLDYPSDIEDAPRSRSFPAVQLFEQVALRLDGAFDLQQNLPAVVRICQLVDGYPLALILAARWLPTLDCEHIAERLSSDLGLIRDPTGTSQSDRHSSMAAVLNYSWELLDAEERSAFSALSLFPGALTPALAQEVAGCSLGTLARLESKSLVRRSGQAQLEIHPLLRSIGESKLAEMDDWSTIVRERHASCFMSALTEAFEEFAEHDRMQLLNRLGSQASDLSLAFRHWCTIRPPAEWAPHVAALWTLYRLHGWFREGAAFLRMVLTTQGLPEEITIRWRLWLTEALFQLGEHEQCRLETVKALRHHGEPLFENERPTGALLNELLRLFVPTKRAAEPESALNDDIARLHNRLAQVYFYDGRRAQFVAATLRSVTLDRAGNLPSHLASAALVLAYTPFRRRAQRYAGRAAEVMARGDPFERAWAHEQLCLYFLSRGSLQAAEHHGAAGQELYWELKQYRNWGECTSLLANTSLLCGDLASAAKYWALARDQGAQVQEAAAQIWGACGASVVMLRQGGDVSLAEFEKHASLLARIVDPNTQLLYRGIYAWLLARARLTDAALSELRTFQWVFDEASMLSIYALNGFVGHLMALQTLHRADSASQSVTAFGRTGMKQLNAFARVFPSARPTAMYLRAAWMDAHGNSQQANRIRRAAQHRLAPGCNREGFALGLADGKT